MAELSQGTDIFMLVANPLAPGEKRIVRIDCPMAFTAGDDDVERHDVTCLSERESRKFLDGLVTPGQGSLTVNANAKYASHWLLYQLSEKATADGKDPVQFAVGWSDGAADVVPQLTNGNTDWELPDTRSWVTFPATISSFPFDFSGETVQTAAALNRSGKGKWLPKAGGAQEAFATEYALDVTDAVGFILRGGASITDTIAADATAHEVEQAVQALNIADSVAVTGEEPEFIVTLTAPTAELTGFGVTVTAL